MSYDYAEHAREARLPLAEFFDAHGHRVTAVPCGPGGSLLAVLTATADEGLNGGHPCFNLANAVEFRGCLDEFIARQQ